MQLVRVGGTQNRHDDGGASRGGQFGDGGCARAANDKACFRQPFVYVRKKRREFDFQSAVGVRLFQSGQVSRPRLLCGGQPVFDGNGQGFQSFGDDFAQDVRALRSAENQQIECVGGGLIRHAA